MEEISHRGLMRSQRTHLQIYLLEDKIKRTQEGYKEKNPQIAQIFFRFLAYGLILIAYSF
jgi:hypothetical protein